MPARFEEPLAEAAILTHRIAGEHCTVDRATGESCAWYHGFWQFMRLMGLGKTSGGHADFLAEELRALARVGGFRRVLISGGADCSMVVLALTAYALESAEADILMVDRCDTPLLVARWYGTRVGVPIMTRRSNILEFESPGQHDVVMTNSFLGNFDVSQRARLFARWAALLRPGGKLIFTNRIRPGAGYAPSGFTPDQARAFRDAVQAEAQHLPPALSLDPDDLARLALAYAERFRSVPVRSTGEVADLLRSGGFRIDRLDTAVAGARSGGPNASPSLAEAATFVRVTATRS